MNLLSVLLLRAVAGGAARTTEYSIGPVSSPQSHTEAQAHSYLEADGILALATKPVQGNPPVVSTNETGRTTAKMHMTTTMENWHEDGPDLVLNSFTNDAKDPNGTVRLYKCCVCTAEEKDFGAKCGEDPPKENAECKGETRLCTGHLEGKSVIARAVWKMDVDGTPISKKKLFTCQQAPKESSSTPAASCKPNDKKPTIHVDAHSGSETNFVKVIAPQGAPDETLSHTEIPKQAAGAPKPAAPLEKKAVPEMKTDDEVKSELKKATAAGDSVYASKLISRKNELAAEKVSKIGVPAPEPKKAGEATASKKMEGTAAKETGAAEPSKAGSGSGALTTSVVLALLSFA